MYPTEPLVSALRASSEASFQSRSILRLLLTDHHRLLWMRNATCSSSHMMQRMRASIRPIHATIHALSSTRTASSEANRSSRFILRRLSSTCRPLRLMSQASGSSHATMRGASSTSDASTRGRSCTWLLHSRRRSSRGNPSRLLSASSQHQIGSRIRITPPINYAHSHENTTPINYAQSLASEGLGQGRGRERETWR